MITLYSTHCPKCNVLERKLKEKHIVYEEVNDIDIMLTKGMSEAPVLEIDGHFLNFKQAIAWINEPESDGV